jgi:hypothetical protein
LAHFVQVEQKYHIELMESGTGKDLLRREVTSEYEQDEGKG